MNESTSQLQPADRQERLRQAQIAILGLLQDSFMRRVVFDDDQELDAIRQRAAHEPADEERLDGSAIVEDSIRIMLQANRIRRRQAGKRHELEITPDGIEWLADERPGVNFDELDRMGAIVGWNLAKMARMREDLQ